MPALRIAYAGPPGPAHGRRAARRQSLGGPSAAALGAAADGRLERATRNGFFGGASVGGTSFGGHGGAAVLGAVRSAVLAEGHHGVLPQSATARPFVTISRQAGAGGRTLARALVERLAAADPAGEHEPAWAGWDRELVDKVARDHGIDDALVATLEERRQPWFADLLYGLSAHPDPIRPDEFRVYKRVAATVRGLARVGRAVIVGRGGVFSTRDLPGGVHVRLVAPRAYRVRHLAALRDITEGEAAVVVDDLDRNREAFYRRYWPSTPLAPEAFTVTLNTGGVSDAVLADCVMPLVLAKLPAATSAASREVVAGGR